MWLEWFYEHLCCAHVSLEFFLVVPELIVVSAAFPVLERELD